MFNKLKDLYLIHLARRISDEDCLRLIIDNELKKYKVNMQYVIANPEINGIPWYTYYTFNSEKEFKRWEKFSKKILRKRHTSGISDDFIRKEFSMLNLMWGLKTNYAIGNNSNS